MQKYHHQATPVLFLTDVIFADLFDEMKHSTTQATSASGPTKNNSHLLNVRACHEKIQKSASMELPNPVVAVVTTSPVTCAGDLRKDWQHPTNQYQNRRINYAY